MKSTSRLAIWALAAASVLSGGLAVYARSEILTLIAAGCAIWAVVVAFSPPRQLAGAPGLAAHASYGPSTSATVDVVNVPSSVVYETKAPPQETQVSVATPATEHSEPEVRPSVRRAPLASLRLTPKMPAGTEPREVVFSLLEGGKAAGGAVAAHLWLEDEVTETLRLIEAQGDQAPASVPVELKSGVLGMTLIEGSARVGSIDGDASHAASRGWRYAIPLSGYEVRGVAAVDFTGREPDLAVLTSLSAALRASLAGALALHVAKSEADSARVLVEACARLAQVLDPDGVLRTALDTAMELAHAQTGSIMLLDPQTRRMRIAIARGLPADVIDSTEVADGDGIAGWVLASKHPLVIEDLKDAGVRSRRHGIRSAVCVPLTDEIGAVGVLNVGCRRFQARTSRSHLQALEALGQTVVAALRSAWAKDGAHDRYFGTLKALAVALETRDPYSLGATERIVELVDAVGLYFGISRAEAEALRIAAMLHDVGMAAAGSAATGVSGPLTTVEWGMLKMHPVIAAEIVSQAPSLSDVVPIVYHHHEHFDGSGYVMGISGTRIPLGSRILAVVDAYVAMTSRRPYRPALSHAQVVGELRERSGTQFDPRVVDAFINIVGEPSRQRLLQT